MCREPFNPGIECIGRAAHARAKAHRGARRNKHHAAKMRHCTQVRHARQMNGEQLRQLRHGGHVRYAAQFRHGGQIWHGRKMRRVRHGWQGTIRLHVGRIAAHGLRQTMDGNSPVPIGHVVKLTTYLGGSKNANDCVCAVHHYRAHDDCVSCPRGSSTTGIDSQRLSLCLCEQACT